MSADCLITKLKGVVSNDELPIVNTIVLDEVAGTLPNSPALLIKCGSQSVHVKSKIKIYKSSSYVEESAVYEKDLSANVRGLLYFKKTDIEGLADKKDLLVISGSGIYQISKIGNTFFTMNNFVRSGLGSQEFNQNILCYGSTYSTNPLQEINPHVEFIQTKRMDYRWFQSPYAIKVFGTGATADSLEVGLNETTAANTSVQTMMKVAGNVKYLPKNILKANLVYATNGTIEELVASMIERGRTSGSIHFDIASATNVTYNGERLGVAGYASTPVLVWANDAISWQASDTTETAAAPTTSMYDYGE